MSVNILHTWVLFSGNSNLSKRFLFFLTFLVPLLCWMHAACVCGADFEFWFSQFEFALPVGDAGGDIYQACGGLEPRRKDWAVDAEPGDASLWPESCWGKATARFFLGSAAPPFFPCLLCLWVASRGNKQLPLLTPTSLNSLLTPFWMHHLFPPETLTDIPNYTTVYYTFWISNVGLDFIITVWSYCLCGLVGNMTNLGWSLKAAWLSFREWKCFFPPMPSWTHNFYMFLALISKLIDLRVPLLLFASGGVSPNPWF